VRKKAIKAEERGGQMQNKKYFVNMIVLISFIFIGCIPPFPKKEFKTEAGKKCLSECSHDYSLCVSDCYEWGVRREKRRETEYGSIEESCRYDCLSDYSSCANFCSDFE
jgi:hypothetical protein